MNGIFRSMAEEKGRGVIFPFTVEKMEAITAGLNPSEKDNILAISGCGDQAFALLEKGSKVTVVDVNLAQLDFLKKRVSAMEREDFTGFYGHAIECAYISRFENRLKYFESKSRYTRIKGNLGNLEILPPISLEEITQTRKFSKIYASDAVGELYCAGPLELHLIQVAKGLERNGLLYLSNGSEINNLVPDISSLGLKQVKDLTFAAQRVEDFYKPLILRKV